MTSILFALEEQFEIRIPEEDIEEGKLFSINAILAYLNNVKNR
jgi:acyl carrier protein